MRRFRPISRRSPKSWSSEEEGNYALALVIFTLYYPRAEIAGQNFPVLQGFPSVLREFYRSLRGQA